MSPDPCRCRLCQAPSEEASWDLRDRRIASDVREHGWHLVGVMPESQMHSWTYSIGLWHTLRSPEVCAFGLPGNVGPHVLNGLADRIRQGAVLHEGERRSDVIVGFDVTIRPVSPDWYLAFFGAGVDFYQRPPMPMVQVCWPDKQGRFAWEADFDPDFRSHQPMLWLPRDKHPSDPWAKIDPNRD